MEARGRRWCVWAGLSAGPARRPPGRLRCGLGLGLALSLGLGLGLGLSLTATAAAAASGPGAGPALDRIHARTFPLSAARGSLERSDLALHGIPVRGAYEVTVIDPEGARRVVAAAAPAAAPALLPEDATISEEEARAIALEHGLDGRPTTRAIQGSRLVYRLILGEPVLAWEVELPLVLSPEPSMKTVWVSAASGVVLDDEEQVHSSRAEVFPFNPAHTPDTIITTLSGIDVDGPGRPLVGSRIQAFNCTLEPPEDQEAISPWWEENECYPLHATFSDENGDFLVPIPDLRFPENNVLGDDLYAELSMYYHAEKFLDHMASLGVDSFKCELSSMLANFRYEEPSVSFPDLDYGPLNNAYYTNQCDAEKGPTMIFGQGSGVDFGYDGDVVYHELGHGMVAHLTPAGLSTRRLRPDASLVDAGGLNEAFADYFSVMLTNQPELGDYVARFWATYGRPYIRTADNEKTCPGNTVGQVHNDGEPFMAALWAARKRIGADKLDRAFIELVMRVPPDSDLETAAWALREIAEERRSAGEWDSSDLQHLIRAFDERSLYDCPRLIDNLSSVAQGRTMYLRSKTSAVTPFFPGPMQLRHQVPEGADNVIVRFRLSPRGTSTGNPNTNPVGALVLVKRGDSPIEFTYDLTAAEEGIDPGAPSTVREIIQVRGDWDYEEVASQFIGSENQLILRGFRPGEVVWVTLVNILTSEAVAGGVSVISVPTEFLDQGVIPGAPGSDPVTEPGAGEDRLEEGTTATACACRSGGPGGPGGAAFLGLLGLALRSRRRSAR